MDDKYTRKVSVPQYLPKDVEPPVKQLIDTKKYEELIDEIEKLELEDKELEKFLKLSATRFINFNFNKIADFYCFKDADVQKMMEKLALVIIDFDDAIKYGYVEMSKRIKEIVLSDLAKKAEEDSHESEKKEVL